MAAAVAGRLSGPEFRRYADPATELEVIRLTDPAFSSGMTAPHLRQFSRRSDALIYSSDRAGGRQAFQIDLRTGDSRQLTDVASLDSDAISLSPDERSLLFFDGQSLNETALSTLKTRQIYRVPEDAVRTGFAVGSDGSVFFIENRDASARIIRVSRRQTGPVFETSRGAADAAVFVIARPRHTQLLLGGGGELWLIEYDGTHKRQVRLQGGITGEVLWSPSGRALNYLHVPEDPKQLITLREYTPEESSDRQLARTSQFAAFSPNSDASVFAGASRSKASAYVLILLRVTRRELTLCEHRASDPAMVSPRFSPDSQSVFFVSDRHGKPALYRVHVEKFVEQTGDDAS